MSAPASALPAARSLSPRDWILATACRRAWQEAQSRPAVLHRCPEVLLGWVPRREWEADEAEPPPALSLLLLTPCVIESSGAGEHPGSPAGNVQEIIQKGKCLPAAQVLAEVNESLGV